MIHLHRLLLLAVVTAPAVAQGQFDLPNVGITSQPVSTPIGATPMRYQQWYAGFELFANLTAPARITGVSLLAAPTAGGQAGQTLEVEVTMAHATSSMTGNFDLNMASDRTVVLPRARIQCGNAAPGAQTLNIQFTTEFLWNGSSPVVVDYKIFDNGNNGQPYAFDNDFQTGTIARMQRIFASNNPNARNATFGPQDSGIKTRFFFNQAIDVVYGQGCPGEGGFVPRATTAGGFPVPGNLNYEMRLDSVPGTRQAVFFMGFSDQTWGMTPLPFALGIIGAPNCNMLAEYVASAQMVTVGGGAGAASARLPFPMPNNTGYIGSEFFSQWLILDPNAPNGVLSMSNGIRHIPGLQ